MLVRKAFWLQLFLLLIAADSATASELTIRLVDEQTKSLVSARVELLSVADIAVTADNAIALNRECIIAPMPGWLQQVAPTTLENPFTGTTQHYLSGVGRYTDIKPGVYALRVFRGPEYRVAKATIQIGEHESKDVVITLERWYDASRLGWYGADDHLHLARTVAGQNESLGQWMSAEGLHIANFVQMGTLSQFGAAPQYAFGDAGVAVHSGVLLLSGQEHPRTHLFGHALTLGAAAPIDERREYALYDATFARGRALGGISGFAHWGIGAASYGLAVNVPKGNVEFLEIFNFEYAAYEVWYQLLNLGFTIAATAGTDFPCLPTLPGRERFYTKIDGQPTRESFVKGLRGQRTFVTNGPMLSLTIDGADIGSRTLLTEPKKVTVVAGVFADPQQDQIQSAQLIQNGRVISKWLPSDEMPNPLRVEVLVDKPSWFALRVTGAKTAETVPSQESGSLWLKAGYENWISGGGGPQYDQYISTRTVRESAAHTSPIYFDFADNPHLSYHRPPDTQWLEKLDELEALLRNGVFDERLILDWIPYSDGISAEHLEKNAPALIKAIAQARSVFRRRLGEP